MIMTLQRTERYIKTIKNKKMKNTEVLNNDVNWHLNGYERYLESDDGEITERISEQIQQGYSSGELCYTTKNGKEQYGYWTTPNWRSIAADLYQACLAVLTAKNNLMLDGAVKTRIKEAVKKLDENWN